MIIRSKWREKNNFTLLSILVLLQLLLAGELTTSAATECFGGLYPKVLRSDRSSRESELHAVVASEALNTLFVGGMTDDCRLMAPNCVFPTATTYN